MHVWERMQQSRFRACSCRRCKSTCPEKAERAPTRICEIPGGKSSFPAGNGENPARILLFRAGILQIPEGILLFPTRIPEIPGGKLLFLAGNCENRARILLFRTGILKI